MTHIRIFDELVDEIALRIRSSSDQFHDHDWIESKRHGDYDLWYVTSGRVHIRSSEGEICAEAGDVVFFYPNFPYTAWAGDEGSAFIFIHFDFAIVEQGEILEQFPFSGVVSGELIREEGRLLREAYESVKAKAGLSRLRLRGAFLILLAKIIESYGEGNYEGTFRTTQGYRGQVADVVTLQPVFKHIHENVHQPVAIRELAELASMSEKYFISFFRRAVGVTPGRYMMSVRMNKAKDYLHRRDYSVKEIASLLGYPDAYSFSRAFKRYFRMAPSQLRE